MIELYLKETPDSGSEAAHQLLRRILQGDFGIREPEIFREQGGKPLCKDGPHFNLSHTRGAILIGVSDSPMGVDVEHLRPVSEKLPRRVLSPGELLWLEGRGSCPEDFLTLWTLKESFFKFQGTGLPGFPNKTELFCQEGLWHMKGQDCAFFTGREKDLFLAVCSEKQTQINLHRL